MNKLGYVFLMQTAHFKQKLLLGFYLAVSRDWDDFEPDESQRVDDDGGSAGGGVAVLGVTVVGIAGEVWKLYLQQAGRSKKLGKYECKSPSPARNRQE